MNRMRHIPVLLVFIFMALVCGSLLSYPAWKLLQAVTDVPFNKIVSQLTSLCGLIFIFLYLKYYKLLNRNVTGFAPAGNSISREIITGIISGILIMAILIIVLLSLNTHYAEPELDITLDFLVAMLLKAVFAGLIVALLEEILYRGALLGALQQLNGIVTAIIVSSLIYSAVHFIKYPELPANTDIHWMTGIALLSQAFFRFADPAIVDSFLALFAFGVLLSLVRLGKNNIYQCIGIHAGVVMAIKIINDLTDYNPENNFDFLVNKYDHLLGYLAFVWLSVLIVLYCKLVLKRLPETVKGS